MKNNSSQQQPPVAEKSKLRENVEAIVIAIILALFIRTFVVQAFKIPSGSMLETLQIGDHILVNKFIYGVKLPFIQNTVIPVSSPDREDIVVFIFPKDPKLDFIKRVIGIGGDVVEIRDRRVYINGDVMEVRPYERHSGKYILPAGYPRDNYGPVTVPEDSLFVMGDNREDSNDSRFWGFVPLKNVKGQAFLIYWSWNKEKFKGLTDLLVSIRWGRIFNLLK